MAPVTTKRRRVDDEVRPPKKKIRVKKQRAYHSSSEDEDEDQLVDEQPQIEKQLPKSILKTSAPATQQEDGEESGSEFEGLDEVERNTILNAAPTNEEDASEAEEDTDEDEDADEVKEPALLGGEINGDPQSQEDSEDADSESEDDISMTSSQAATAKKKRNDPTAFATSISKILDTKLTTSKRQDPVLSRSKAAHETNKSQDDSKLEAAARAQLRAEKKTSLQKGRITDVLGLQTPDVDTGTIMEEERRLKKTAQRGVVKLFNAVRAAQVKAEEGMRQAREQGVVGMQKREERVQEMSKEGFLELISRGGGGGGVQQPAKAAV